MTGVQEFDDRMARIARLANEDRIVREISPGVNLWTDPYVGRRDENGNGIGGICLNVLVGNRRTDEFGEIIELEDRYRCYNPFAPFPSEKSYVTVARSEVNLDTLQAPNSGDLVIAFRRFCAHVGQHRQARGTRRHGSRTLDSRDVETFTDAVALFKVITAPYERVAQ